MHKPPKWTCDIVLAPTLAEQPSCFIPGDGHSPGIIVVAHQGSMKANIEEARRTHDHVRNRRELRLIHGHYRKKR
jgi:hypothetical protein